MIEAMREIIDKIAESSEQIDPEKVRVLVQELAKAPSVFVHGVGRSGLVGRAFAMRLMHLGLRVYVVGDTTTPAIQPGDALVTITGSGETPAVRVVAEEAKRRGAKILTITATPNSAVAHLSDLVVVVPGRVLRTGDRDYLARQVAGVHEPLTPLSTAFELTAMVLCDAMIVSLMRQLGKTETEMVERHATLQ